MGAVDLYTNYFDPSLLYTVYAFCFLTQLLATAFWCPSMLFLPFPNTVSTDSVRYGMTMKLFQIVLP
jgi:hypothetical protein